jgi:putative ABC transport system permease protein
MRLGTALMSPQAAIGGLFRLGASFGADASLMTSDQTFLRLFPRRDAGSISLGLIRLKPGYKPRKSLLR